MSKAKNLVRFDLSPYLIHFVRPMKIDRGDAPEVPEHWGWGNLNEDDDYSPFFLLRCIIRHGRIWATWSYRDGNRTIYGPRPAVCMTEMPLAAFVQSSRARAARGEKISPYGLVIPKAQAFKVGARPVIYGLSESVRSTNRNDGARMLPTSALPEREQYRYVVYDPADESGPDWTHEREWRWPGHAREPDADGLPPASWEEIPGLKIYDTGFRGLGAIVRSDRQARLLVHDILRLVDQGVLAKEAFHFILQLEGLPTMGELWRPTDVMDAVNANTINLNPYFEVPEDADELIDRFEALIRQVTESAGDDAGENGGCWLWLYDNTHPLVRSMLHRGWPNIEITKVGRYLVPLPEFGDSLGLRPREKLTRKLAELVETEFGLPCGYFSVLGSDDPNDIPFYCDIFDSNDIFFNESWHEDDY